MKSFLKEFKAFASGGNLIDLAIGFVIGAAFAGLVESFAKNIIGDLIAAVGGNPDLSGWTIKIRGSGEDASVMHIGTFVGEAISFVILALVLFMVVKGLMRAKVGNFRAQGQRECPWCREFVAVDAVRCKHCTSDLRAEIDAEEGADERVPS